MKKSINVLLISFLSIFIIQQNAFTMQTKSTCLGLNSIDKIIPAGKYDIYVQKENKWQKAGSIGYDRFLREQTLDISSYVLPQDGRVKIRVTQNGGGAAHIDYVLLGGKAPVSVNGAPLAKVSKKDNDIADAFGKTIELEYDGNSSVLSLAARIENKVISKEAFKFPTTNTYKKIEKSSSFYNYKLGSNNTKLNIDGDIKEISSKKPFFKEYSVTGSGHPSGYTYGWVSNDNDNLYAAIDFTPDNTIDGGKDYTSVYVKTLSGIKEFKVSELQKQWGMPAFCYTDKIGYQHKTYEFKIPIRGLDIVNNKLELAFSAYGTATVGNYIPALAYDPVNNIYLLVYSKVDTIAPYIFYYGQFLHADGSPSGAAFAITDSSAAVSQIKPSVAYDWINKKFLVAWRDYRNSNYDIYGQIVRSGQILTSPANIPISTATDSQQNPNIAFELHSWIFKKNQKLTVKMKLPAT
ncbi:MAG: hypothetical protein MUC95_08925, partial [Spirochaetes bacterium]|nr:hypothetical protein [Spirochaetota bacterium]